MERYFKHPLLFWDCYKTAFSFWNVTACAPRKVIFANVRFRVKYFLKCVIPFGKWISVWKWNNSVFRNISDRRHSLFLDSAILRKTAISRNVSDKREKARVGNVWKETWVVWWVRKIFLKDSTVTGRASVIVIRDKRVILRETAISWNAKNKTIETTAQNLRHLQS